MLLLVVLGSVWAAIGWLKDLDLEVGILALRDTGNPFGQLQQTLCLKRTTPERFDIIVAYIIMC